MTKIHKAPSKLEATLSLRIRGSKLPVPVKELHFHPSRKWRFDFAWPELMLVVEAQDGAESHGTKNRAGLVRKNGHLVVSGYRKDCEKYNEAAMLGWTVLRFTGAMITDGTAIVTIEKAIRKNEAA